MAVARRGGGAPVLAAPSTSLPCSKGGILFAWISIILVNPISAIAFCVLSLRSKVVKSDSLNTASCWDASVALPAVYRRTLCYSETKRYIRIIPQNKIVHRCWHKYNICKAEAWDENRGKMWFCSNQAAMGQRQNLSIFQMKGARSHCLRFPRVSKWGKNLMFPPEKVFGRL